MTLENLKQEMQSGVVEFKYRKKDGEIRVAQGTTNLDLIKEYGEDKLPKGTGIQPESTTRYFDIDKEAWRSFQNDSYIEN